MPHTEAQAWWADVQHVRETIERRRAGLADSPAPDIGADTRFERRAAAPLSVFADLDPTQVSATPAGGRSDRGARSHGDAPAAAARRRGDDVPDRSAPRWRRDEDRPDVAASVERARPPRRGTVDERVELAPPVVSGGMTQTPLARPSRRTVEITGRTVGAPPVPRLVEVERRRPPRRTIERVGPRPDRIALWAVLLGFFLILVAATSSRAATPVGPGHAGAAVGLHAAAR